MRVRLFVLFGLAFVVFYGSANLLTSLHSWRWPVSPPSWPFWPEWSGVYLSLDLLLPLAFWRVAGPGRLTAALLFSTLVAWPFFLLFPLPAIAVPAGDLVFQIADVLNLDANFFPSLHVAYALLCAAFLGRWWGWLWALAIAFSTLVTHQHYTLDLVGAVLLAGLSLQWAGRAEGICLQEIVRCATRHRRYALIGVGLVAASLFAWRKRRLARVGFCYLQHLDDVLDGHLAVAGEPEELATFHQQALLGERDFDVRRDLEFLGQLMREDLGESVHLAVAVIEEMKLDRRRVWEQILLSEADLDRHLERTFELSLDLMLVAAGSPLRSRQVPHLVKALGWCSVVRDFAEDRALGLINLPAEYADDADGWMARRRVVVREDLRKARAELGALRGESGYGLLMVFLRSVEGYARRLSV